MSRTRRVSGALATVVLLAVGISAASLSASQEPSQQDACAYKPIAIDTGSLPQPVRYPEDFSEKEKKEEGSPSARSGLPTYGLEELKDPPVLEEGPITMEDGKEVRSYKPLEIQYSNPQEDKIAGCGLRVRTYNGELVAPTLRAKPGQTMKFTVTTNKLREQEHSTQGGTEHNYDLTNLHTHGLFVSPTGKGLDNRNPASDNVLITYEPPDQQEYGIEIPKDHAPGAHWYHAHAHGSTAIQVAGGMAGALVIEDDKSNPDFPDSLKSVPEKTLVFQSLFYDKNGEAVDPLNPPQEPDPNNPEKKITIDWQKSQRRITINGQVVPKITMRPGEVQRWRMVGAMFQELLELQLAGHDLNEIATDGFYLPRVNVWKPGKSVELHTGYRSDVLVKASSERGTYILADRRTPVGVAADAQEAQQAVDNAGVLNEDASILAAVVVEGEAAPATKLPEPEEMQKISYDRAVGAEGEGNSLEEQWNKDPANDDPDPEKRHIQRVHFNLGPISDPPDPDNDEAHFAINHNVYPDAPVRELVLDRIDRWELVTETKNPHLFHIHVNPFQVERKGPDGQTERVWKDTITVRRNDGEEGAPDQPLIVYTKYRRFTGKFVIHCHLLHHEDDGMMQVVDVVGATP